MRGTILGTMNAPRDSLVGGGSRASLWASLACALVLTWGAGSVEASAQFAADPGLVAAIVIPPGIVGLGVLALAVADVVSFAMDSPWDDGWAIVDLITGSLFAVGGIITLGAIAALDYDPVAQGAAGGVGAGLLAFAGLFIGHGAWSLANNDRIDVPYVGVLPFLAPVEGGGLAGVGGSF
jgi:hypothetical protein